MARDIAGRLPRGYARSKLSMIRRRYQGSIKTSLDRMVPIAFPNADRDGMVLTMLGFTAFSTGVTENTTEAVLTQPFHEVGLFQCPAGPRGGPAPNPNPRAPNNAYGRLATSDLVKRMLGGRSANMTPDGWKTDIESQLAVGIANLLGDEAALRSGLGDLVGSTSAWSDWRVWCMFTAFSRGPGQTRAVLAPYRDRLAAVPESLRLRKLRELVVADIKAGRSGIGTRKGKMGTAYAIERSDQKLQSAVLLAADAGKTIPFLTERYQNNATDNEQENIITRTGEGSTLTAAVENVSEAVQGAVAIIDAADPLDKGLAGLVIAGTIIGGVVSVWQLMKA